MLIAVLLVVSVLAACGTVWGGGRATVQAIFEKMKDEYYQLRGWDVATGLQTKTKLKELGLQDIAQDLAPREQII